MSKTCAARRACSAKVMLWIDPSSMKTRELGVIQLILGYFFVSLITFLYRQFDNNGRSQSIRTLRC